MEQDVAIRESVAKKAVSQDVEKLARKYEYPYGDMKPGSTLHSYVLNEVLRLAGIAQKPVDSIREEVRKIEYTLTAYVPKGEMQVYSPKSNVKRPLSVVLPMTFASLETFLTYMSGTFLSNTEIHRYRGVKGREGMISAMLMERLVARQSLWFQDSLRFETQWRDGFTYGVGYTAHEWRKHRAEFPEYEEVGSLLEMALKDKFPNIKKGDFIKTFTEQTLYEGVESKNLDIHNMLVDPNCPVNEIQKSRFIGWVTRGSVNDLLRREDDPEEGVFNAEYVRCYTDKSLGKSKFYKSDLSGRNDRMKVAQASPDDTDALDTITMFIDIIPEKWGLAKRSKPEKWWFEISADCVVTKCKPLGLKHGWYPITAAAPNSNGYDVFPVSHLATTYGLQSAIDWYIRSRMANVAKTLNDMLVVDPSRVNWDDVCNPSPGKLIRVLEAAYGVGNVGQWVHQMQTQDVTGGHIRDAQWLIEILQQTVGTNKVAMGMLDGMPERPTAEGINAAKTGSMSRLAFIAQKIACQSINPAGFQKAHMTLQYMDEDMQVAVLGRYADRLRWELGLPENQNDMTVTPMMLNPFMEVEPWNGALVNMDNVNAQTEVMKTFLGVEGVAVDLMKRFDIYSFFNSWVRAVGCRDLSEFRKMGGEFPQVNVQTMPDEQAMSMAQGGDLVPIGQAFQ